MPEPPPAPVELPPLTIRADTAPLATDAARAAPPPPPPPLVAAPTIGATNFSSAGSATRLMIMSVTPVRAEVTGSSPVVPISWNAVA